MTPDGVTEVEGWLKKRGEGWLWARDRGLIHQVQPEDRSEDAPIDAFYGWVLDPLTAMGVALVKELPTPLTELDGVAVRIDDDLLGGPPPHANAVEQVRLALSSGGTLRILSVQLGEDFLASAPVADIVKEATKQLGLQIIEAAKSLGRTT